MILNHAKLFTYRNHKKRNKMKKVITILIAVSLALSLFSQGAQEAVVEQKVEEEKELF